MIPDHKEILSLKKRLIKFELEILSGRVSLDIYGFNAKKCIETSIVKLPLSINNNWFTIEAIVVPKIDIYFKASPLVSIVQTFKGKGYALADTRLVNGNSSVDNIDIVMGPDATRLLNPQTVAFGGESGSSVYLSTTLGVMLMGESENLLRDLKETKMFINTLEKVNLFCQTSESMQRS